MVQLALGACLLLLQLVVLSAAVDDAAASHLQSGNAAVTCGFGGIDLSGLTRTSDYNGQDEEYNYKMNVCGASNTQYCGPSTICQWNTGGSLIATLGKFTGVPSPTWSWMDEKNHGAGIAMQYTNGDGCWVGPGMPPLTRTVNVQFVCRPGAGTDSVFTVREDPGCKFYIQLNTDQSCQPGSGDQGGLSGGSAFLIIMLVLVILYVAGGCFYKRVRLGATTMKEGCPQQQFWFALPGLVKDGCKYTYQRVRTGCKSGTSQTYDEL